MDGMQDQASDQPERDIEAERAADPKPVFDGDWQSATGVQKGQHSERVRQWRRREEERAEAEAQRRMAAGFVQPVSPVAPSPAADDPTRAVLVAIRDDVNALASDRIRAAQTLIGLDRGEAQQGPGESDLVQLRAVLETLQPHERLAWLQGERAEGIAARATS